MLHGAHSHRRCVRAAVQARHAAVRVHQARPGSHRVYFGGLRRVGRGVIVASPLVLLGDADLQRVVHGGTVLAAAVLPRRQGAAHALQPGDQVHHRQGRRLHDLLAGVCDLADGDGGRGGGHAGRQGIAEPPHLRGDGPRRLRHALRLHQQGLPHAGRAADGAAEGDAQRGVHLPHARHIHPRRGARRGAPVRARLPRLHPLLGRHHRRPTQAPRAHVCDTGAGDDAREARAPQKGGGDGAAGGCGGQPGAGHGPAAPGGGLRRRPGPRPPPLQPAGGAAARPARGRALSPPRRREPTVGIVAVPLAAREAAAGC
mmetsp:Transcript_35240/g.77026  ORF Transcript_35240/g.77026 Transcript_35240/m.77026 type:complete len:315 (-) Transcript_35240:373-1317(-)